jgi:hypothetical protein
VNRKLNRAVRQWLQLEHAERPESAEEALQDVFSRLPLEPVPAGFADRLLSRAGLGSPVTAGPSWAVFWGLRAAISLCLLLVALFLLVIPSYVPALLGIFNLSRATEMGVSALVGVFHQLGAGLVVWRALSVAGSIVSSTLSSPQDLTALFLAVLLSIGALRALHEVIIAERSTRYVGSA